MNPKELEALLALEVAANRSLDWLLERIFNEEGQDEAVDLLKVLANKRPDDALPILTLQHYRAMRGALDEQDYWDLSTGNTTQDSRFLRKERALLYQKYRYLFELEIKIARRQRYRSMAISNDWSGLGATMKGRVRATAYQGLLWAAGLMFRAGIPGALDLCDEAAFGMLRMVYLRPVT